jgi:hypothetical protein
MSVYCDVGSGFLNITHWEKLRASKGCGNVKPTFRRLPSYPSWTRYFVHYLRIRLEHDISYITFVSVLNTIFRTLPSYPSWTRYFVHYLRIRIEHDISCITFVSVLNTIFRILPSYPSWTHFEHYLRIRLEHDISYITFVSVLNTIFRALPSYPSWTRYFAHYLHMRFMSDILAWYPSSNSILKITGVSRQQKSIYCTWKYLHKNHDKSRRALVILRWCLLYKSRI